MTPSTPRLVAIAGGSGAGKTWLATQLQLVFGKDCSRLCLDNFYRDRSHLSPARRARLNFDHPRAIDWPLLDSTLRKCLQGQSILVPRYNFSEHRRLGKGDRWEPRPLVILEGLWLFHRPVLRRLFTLKIFLDCPQDIRFERRLQRDLIERGRTAESVREQFEQTVAPMHERFVAPQVRWADVCFSGAPSTAQLKKVIERLRISLATESAYE